ncbi:MAG TPA: FliG C-terminal domain-containing protein [Thermoguttaceae bacterium]|nr:FliG C-terminal domain-containing protein [Thermoguttaceae bacterium]
MSRPIVFIPLGLLVLGAVLLGADWWICLPEGKVATYVGREQCARCHQKEMDVWAGSDHDLAMDHATGETVLGDFGEAKYVHVVFSDVTRLTDGEVRALLEETEVSQWALALRDAREEVKAKVLANMPAEDAAALDEQVQFLRIVRPADVATARHEIAQTMRRLERAGTIDLGFALTTEFSRDGEKFFVRTDGPTGEMVTYPIKYVFGVRPLQQYLIEFPDGRVQCLGVAWDTEKKEWYHLYPDERIPAGDELHWTQPSQNWNFMCAECHSTNLEKNFDLASNAFHTTSSEIDVSCETCHGPGSLHVELADSNSIFWDRRVGYGLPRLKDEDPRVEIETCAPCHSRRGVVYPNHRGGKRLPDGPGQKFLDHYVPGLIHEEYYSPDGQVLGEDYVYGSYLQSKMYGKGVRCTDCHDPHTMRVKFVDPKGPRDKIPNKVCTDCHLGMHPAGQYDTQSHHFHPDSSQPGTQCVDCHMPETPYMVVDPRRDHSMRIPRPDLTSSLGIPNACNGCHHDRSKGETPEWAEAKLREWYGERDQPEHFAYAIAAGRQHRPEGEEMLRAVIKRTDASAMVRASALVLLGEYESRAWRITALKCLEDPEALVRMAAVQSFLPSLGEGGRSLRENIALQREIRQIEQLDDLIEQRRRLHELGASREQIVSLARVDNVMELYPELQESYRRLVPMLSDPVRAVRTETARAICNFPLVVVAENDREAFDKALAEYMAGQAAESDRVEAHMNMATVYRNLGQFDKAEQAYLDGIRVNPQFPQARINLATTYGEHGKKAEAEQQFRGAIELLRDLIARTADLSRDVTEAKWLLAETHYSFGLLLGEDKQRLKEAAEQLGEAVRTLPEDTPGVHDPLAAQRSLRKARMHYNHGLTLQHLAEQDDTQRAWTDDAEKALKAAYDLSPGDPDFLAALGVFYLQQKQWDPAGRYAEQLARLHPRDPRGPALLEEIARRAGNGRTEEP